MQQTHHANNHMNTIDSQHLTCNNTITLVKLRKEKISAPYASSTMCELESCTTSYTTSGCSGMLASRHLDTMSLKLSNIGVRGKLLQWIECFLLERTQHVVVDGIHSSPARVASGVPQGTVLGPLLFIIYINDITKAITHSKIKIFADDSKLLKDISGLDDHIQLQSDLNAVIQWAKDNNMQLNMEKFELIHFGKKDALKIMPRRCCLPWQ